MKTIVVKYCPKTIANILLNNQCVVHCYDNSASFYVADDSIVCEWNGGKAYHHRLTITEEEIEAVLESASIDSWENILFTIS